MAIISQNFIARAAEGQRVSLRVVVFVFVHETYKTASVCVCVVTWKYVLVEKRFVKI